MKNFILTIIGILIISFVYSQEWNINGNSTTDTVNNFFGTTIKTSVIIKTDNIQRMKFNCLGLFNSIGQHEPTCALDVFGENYNNNYTGRNFRVTVPTTSPSIFSNTEFSALTIFDDPYFPGNSQKSLKSSLYSVQGAANYSGYFDGIIRCEGKASIGIMPSTTIQPVATLEIFGNAAPNFRVTGPWNSKFCKYTIKCLRQYFMYKRNIFDRSICRTRKGRLCGLI